MNRLRRTICFAFIASAAVVAALDASAQTCRVMCGVSPSGVVKYKEVYEYDYVSEKPAFPGGCEAMVKFINKTRKYPAQAYNKGIEGRVTVSFVVNADGSVSNISVFKGAHASLNEEAVRIIEQMPDWTPGKLNGRAVPVRVLHTIAFRK